MKEVINLPKKFNNILIIGFALIAVALFVFFTVNAIRYDQKMEALQKRQLNALIQKSKEETRGFYCIVINDHISKTSLKYSLSGSWFL